MTNILIVSGVRTAVGVFGALKDTPPADLAGSWRARPSVAPARPQSRRSSSAHDPHFLDSED